MRQTAIFPLAILLLTGVGAAQERSQPPAQPMFVMSVSAAHLDRNLPPVFEDTCLRFGVRGFDVNTCAHVKGRTRIELVPCETEAILRVMLTGETVGSSHAARHTYHLGTTDCTSFQVMQPISLTGPGARAFRPLLWVQAHSRVHCLGTQLPPLSDLLFRGAVRIVAPLRQRSTDRLATSVALELLRDQLDDKVNLELARVNADWRQRLAPVLAQLDARLEDVHFSTTATDLRVAFGVSPGERAWAPPSPGAGAWARLHESLINVAFQRRFRGRTVTSADVEKTVRKFFSSPGKRPPDDGNERPWSVTFAKSDPLTVRFEADTLVLKLRGERYATEEQSSPAMDVTARYRLKRVGGAWRLVRDAELEIYPPGFVPGSGQRLGARQQILRTVLRRRFGRLLVQDVSIDALFELAEVRAFFAQLGKPVVTLRQGWLGLEWPLDSSLPDITATAN